MIARSLCVRPCSNQSDCKWIRTCNRLNIEQISMKMFFFLLHFARAERKNILWIHFSCLFCPRCPAFYAPQVYCYTWPIQARIVNIGLFYRIFYHSHNMQSDICFFLWTLELAQCVFVNCYESNSVRSVIMPNVYAANIHVTIPRNTIDDKMYIYILSFIFLSLYAQLIQKCTSQSARKIKDPALASE